MLPPCASTTERQIESPRPSPPGLVVTNGSNRRSFASRGTPSPRSETENVPLPSTSRRVATVMRLRSGGSVSTASMALRTRFSATCSISSRSARTAGGVADTRHSKVMPASRAAGSARRSTASTSSFRFCSVNAGPGGRRRSLSRWMILPARFAWSRQMCIACCSSPLSGLPDCSMRMQLWS